MIKTLKLNKKHLSDPIKLLIDIGAKDEKKNQVFPEKVFMNLKDYNVMKKMLAQRVKKGSPYLTSKKVNELVGLHLLNFGPVEVKRGVEQGYVIYIQD